MGMEKGRRITPAVTHGDTAPTRCSHLPFQTRRGRPGAPPKPYQAYQAGLGGATPKLCLKGAATGSHDELTTEVGGAAESWPASSGTGRGPVLRVSAVSEAAGQEMLGDGNPAAAKLR